MKSVRFKIVRQFALEIVGEKSLKDYTSKNEDKTMTIISITFRNTEKKSPPVGRGKADDEEPLTGPKIWNQDDGAAIAWDQEECGDATEAGGGNLHRDGEPLPGAEKTEATTRQRPAGATSTGDGNGELRPPGRWE